YSIRIFDLQRNFSRRLVEPGTASRPVWSSDGKDITYAATQGNVSHIYQIPADGSAAPRSLRSGTVMLPNSWSPDLHLMFQTTDSGLPSLEVYSASDESVKPFASGVKRSSHTMENGLRISGREASREAGASWFRHSRVEVLPFRSPAREEPNRAGAVTAGRSSTWPRTAN